MIENVNRLLPANDGESLSGQMHRLFEQSGVEFFPGSSVFFNTNSQKLLIRNTGTNMDLVETIIHYLHSDK